MRPSFGAGRQDEPTFARPAERVLASYRRARSPLEPRSRMAGNDEVGNTKPSSSGALSLDDAERLASQFTPIWEVTEAEAAAEPVPESPSPEPPQSPPAAAPSSPLHKRPV